MLTVPNDSNKIRVSYSQYKMWLECPFSWKLRYIDKLKTSTNIHSIFGDTVHEIVQEWLRECLFGDKSLRYSMTVDLSEKFRSRLIELAKPHIKQIDESGNEYFLFTRQELEDFYNHGLEIISYVQCHSDKIFPTQDTVLYAIEYELNEPLTDNVDFIGYIDIITYNERTNEFHLYDLKTSSRGWNNYAKKDKKKTDQLLLYKLFFYKKLIRDGVNITLDEINISYVILKRILVESPYPNPRVSQFTPSHGSTSLKRAWSEFSYFMDLVFSPNGCYIIDQKANPSKNNCRFCNYNKICQYVYSEKQEKNKGIEQWVTL